MISGKYESGQINDQITPWQPPWLISRDGRHNGVGAAERNTHKPSPTSHQRRYLTTTPLVSWQSL